MYVSIRHTYDIFIIITNPYAGVVDIYIIAIDSTSEIHEVISTCDIEKLESENFILTFIQTWTNNSITRKITEYLYLIFTGKLLISIVVYIMLLLPGGILSFFRITI